MTTTTKRTGKSKIPQIDRGVVDIETLRAAGYNPRKIDKASKRALGKSLRRFGLVQEIVVNRRNGVIVGGHQRVDELRAMGETQVPVAFVDLDDVDEKALNVLLNSRHVQGEFDTAMLGDLLAEIESAGAFPLADFRLDDLLADITPKLDDDEKEPPAPRPRQARRVLDGPGSAVVLVGDMREHLRAMPDASVDAIVTDPPYGLSAPPDIAVVMRAWLAGDEYEHDSAGFMGRDWDAFVPGPTFWREAFRVLKPGGHVVAFAGTRTVDLMAIAMRFAGFEVRDQIAWMYGQGFPKSLDVSKAIDAHLGAEREVVGERRKLQSYGPNEVFGDGPDKGGVQLITAPATADAARWSGWGTALKPAMEPAILARRPIEGTVAENVLRHGVGGLDIDGTRIGTEGGTRATQFDGSTSMFGIGGAGPSEDAGGRWPANVALAHSPGCVQTGTRKVRSSAEREGPRGRRPRGMGESMAPEGNGDPVPNGPSYGDADGTETSAAWDCVEGCAVRMLDEQSGELASGVVEPHHNRRGRVGEVYSPDAGGKFGRAFGGDTGGASRFFQTVQMEPEGLRFRYEGKASTSEREDGLGDLPLRPGHELVDREPDTAGLDNPRAGAGRTSSGRANGHPTVKPIDLMRWLVRMVTPPGGTVLDPFCGSGTTGVAAVHEGVRFIGIELLTDHACIAWRRIENARSELAGVPLADVLASGVLD